MNEQAVLATIGPLSVTAYGLMISLAAAAGFLCMRVSARRLGLPADTAVRFGLWAIPLGLAFGRGLFVLLRWNLVVDVLGWPHLFMVWDGGFALFGVLPGCLLAAYFCARRMRVRAADQLDAAAPGAALALGVARFAEVFTLQGVGRPVELPALQWFPLAVQNGYGDWVLPVFFWEGVSALAIAWIAARALRRKPRRPGDAVSLFLLGLGVTQVLLESLRTDDILRLGLVRVSQLAAMACVLAAAVVWMIPAVRMGKLRKGAAGYGACLLSGVAVCTYLEYALDKTSVSNVVLYLAMAAVLACMASLIGRLRGLSTGKRVQASADPPAM